MNICIFSKKGIVYDNNKKSGPLTVIAVPSNDQKRQYADIANPSKSVIKDRYGVLEGELAYRTESGVVTVYGNVPKDISELRQEVKAYLPEDFAPLDVNVLYYVVGENLIIHSVRTIEVDGTSKWNSLYIELEKKGAGVLNVVENLISERIVSVNDEKILVAYTNLPEAIKEELYTRVNQFGVLVEPMENLTDHRQKTPVYSHKDNSILLMIFIIIAAILTVLSLSYYISGKNNYSSSEDKIVKLEQELRTSLSKMRLKKVSNPQQVKDSVEKTFKARPSAILHSAAEVASLFGVLETITLTKNYQDRFTRAIENKPQDDVIYVQANVRANENSLLIDQERLAKSVYETRKWIRSIERSNRSGDGSLTLKIGVYVGDYGD
jgi:hypothetical protein|tara:strand:- start:394 stop:1533 length:1140 start_codon:yes stop_codon:yes gene_type:complete